MPRAGRLDQPGVPTVICCAPPALNLTAAIPLLAGEVVLHGLLAFCRARRIFLVLARDQFLDRINLAFSGEPTRALFVELALRSFERGMLLTHRLIELNKKARCCCISATVTP